MKVSIIIPCFNEKDTVEALLDNVNQDSFFDKEIIIIDDFSTDGTREILKKINDKYTKLILNEINSGKGYCIQRGIKEANGDIILIQDADLEYSPTDYKKLIDPITNGDADVVFGSRFVGSQQTRVLYFWHTVGNKFLTILSNMFTNLNLTDMECCYKVFKKDVIYKIRLKENRFGFEPEVTAKLSKMNIKIYEVGVKYFGRKYSEGKKISWKDGFAAIYHIIRYNLFS
tara:strand:+ start:3196 stop:3882 length:687 start_codon:yes stop_codon:yes gene_type:complete